MKTALLGVPEEVLREHTAVSEPVAEAMACGARERTGSTLGSVGDRGGRPGRRDGSGSGGHCRRWVGWTGGVPLAARDFHRRPRAGSDAGHPVGSGYAAERAGGVNPSAPSGRGSVRAGYFGSGRRTVRPVFTDCLAASMISDTPTLIGRATRPSIG